MKKFKQFRAEQQYITEVGPFASAMMVAMGAAGLGLGGWKLFKKTKESIKGYRESKAEKKENKDSGITISIKKFNPETGKDEAVPVDIPAGDKRANVDDDGILKLEKEEQKKATKANKDAAKAWKAKRDDLEMTDKEYVDHLAKEKGDKKREAGGDVKTPADEITLKYMKFDRTAEKLVPVEEPASKDMFDDEIVQFQKDKTAEAKKKLDDYKAAKDKEDEPETDGDEEEPETTDDGGEGEKEDEVEKDDEGNIKNQDDAQAAFEKGDFKKAPSGWTKDPEDETGKTVIKPEDIKKKQSTQGKTDAPKGALTKLAKGKKLTSQNILSFGEFITEGVMKDLLKAGKSKKDSEITLDDGADIPIDPLTSQILVKYIEGLSSSEKNRTIQQIQRTERAFMKVLGKAHENI